MARTIPRTFKHFILGAAAVWVLKPRNALMASQRKDTPATTRDCPYCRHSVPLQATRRPSRTADLLSALVLVEPAYAEAGPLERGARSASAFSRPFALARCAHLCDHPRRMAAADVLAERLPRRVELTIQLPL
jgi:hypothetical protein